MSSIRPRYLPQQAWPAYAYLPGRDPHPQLDARGHARGEADASPDPVEPAHWSSSTHYLRGVDLYNHGYHWEAHEAWEALWHVAYDPIQHTFLQGLIQAAAAALQQRLVHEVGRVRLTERAVARLRSVREARGDRYMGVQLPSWIAALEHYAREADSPPVLWLSD